MPYDKNLRFQAYGSTDRGLVREKNEDHLLVDEALRIFAVADGLGGLPEGALASAIAVKSLQHYAQQCPAQTLVPFKDCFNYIQQEVEAQNSELLSDIGMATTLTAAQLLDGHLHIAHIGDTGVFLFRDKTWRQLTEDHTMAQEFLDQMPQKDLSRVPEYFYHTLTRCIGQSGDINVDLLEIPVRAGDRFLIYSDGVTKTWEMKELQSCVENAADPKTLVHHIITTANERGGPDNTTVIALFAESSG